MSFSSETKKAVAKIIPEDRCCMLAEIAGYARIRGILRLSGGGHMSVSLSAEDPAVVRTLKQLTAAYFDADSEIQLIQGSMLKKEHRYRLIFDDERTGENILRETGMLKVRDGGNVLMDGIDAEIIRKNCCKKACLRGLFLAAGTVNDPEKGYHLEIVCSDKVTAADVKKLMNQFSLRAKVTERRGSWVVYIKGSERVADFLKIIGAYNQVFRLEDVLALKSLRNKTNRIVNCENANLDRSVDAATRQLRDIQFIEKHLGLDQIPDRLRNAAELRLTHPELPLSELAKLADPPVSKSGLNHRFVKIAETAERLRESSGSHRKSAECLEQSEERG